MAEVRLSGRRALLEQLRADGVRYVFGNPGTSEQPFMDALVDFPDIRFVLALHEGVAVCMADGYARLTHRPAFVQLHTASGVGNGLGMLLNARETHTPLVVYAGQLASAGLFQEPLLSGPIVDMARSVCKWAAQVEHTRDVPQAVRRAFKVAAEPPQGPVLLAVPMDVLDADALVDVVPTNYTRARVRPEAAAIDEAAQVLLKAQRPLLVLGDGVAAAQASSEAVSVAELLGAPMVPYLASDFTAPASHPLLQGMVAVSRSRPLRTLLAQHDAVLVLGMPVFPLVFPDPGEPPVPPGVRVVHVDNNPWELGKNFTPAVSILADVRAALVDLAERLRSRQTPAHALAAERRTRLSAEQSRVRRAHEAQASREGWNNVPTSVGRLLHELRAALPDNTLVFAEGSTNRGLVESVLAPEAPGRLVHARGSGLGPGLPGALGAQLACPDRKVVGICADGAALFSLTALWTAAHERIPVTYVMLNNGAYRVLKLNMLEYRGPSAPGRPFIGMDLADPSIRFDRIADGMGVPAWRVDDPAQLASVFAAAIATPGPSLVDAVVQCPMPQPTS